MRTFVLRARAAPTDSQKLLAGVGKEAHTEILAHTLDAQICRGRHTGGQLVQIRRHAGELLQRKTAPP